MVSDLCVFSIQSWLYFAGRSIASMGEEDGDRTILVSGVSTDVRLEAIQSYFENKRRSNGGPLKGKPKRIQDSGKVIITFEVAEGQKK